MARRALNVTRPVGVVGAGTMGAGLTHPKRLVGMHFFNPVPAMRLVEVISGLATAPSVADRAAELATEWGKTVVRSTATPGFIVNRIARPFYAEAWLGVNYPRGPLTWAREWGVRTVLTVLDSLENWYRDGHYRASPLLRRAALSGRDLL